MHPALGHPYRWEVEAANAKLAEEQLRIDQAVEAAMKGNQPYLVFSRKKAHINLWRLLGVFLAALVAGGVLWLVAALLVKLARMAVNA